MSTNSFSFVFFGTPDIAVASLEQLALHNLLPSLIVTAPDKPYGRGLALAPSPVKAWANARGIPVLEPVNLSDANFIKTLQKADADVFVLVAYGRIIPQTVLDIPRKGTLNMHPSLLPKHRGASPIESQILHETDAEGVGVSVMLLDAEMDHGPLLAQKNVADTLPTWPIGAESLRSVLAERGGKLLAETLPAYVAGNVVPREQVHDDATYCKKITKEDALIDLSSDAAENYRKILAYQVWPRAYFFAERNGRQTRVVIAQAKPEDGALTIERVIPEGKKEMPYKDFLAGMK